MRISKTYKLEKTYLGDENENGEPIYSLPYIFIKLRNKSGKIDYCTESFNEMELELDSTRLVMRFWGENDETEIAITFDAVRKLLEFVREEMIEVV